MRISMASSKNKNRKTGKNSKNGTQKISNPLGPWKPSWYVLWGFISVMGELLLISLVRNNVVVLNALQIIVFFVCIPIFAHLLISGLRKFLFLILPTRSTK
jgi:hypothetical protein